MSGSNRVSDRLYARCGRVSRSPAFGIGKVVAKGRYHTLRHSLGDRLQCRMPHIGRSAMTENQQMRRAVRPHQDSRDIALIICGSKPKFFRHNGANASYSRLILEVGSTSSSRYWKEARRKGSISAVSRSTSRLSPLIRRVASVCDQATSVIHRSMWNRISVPGDLKLRACTPMVQFVPPQYGSTNPVRCRYRIVASPKVDCTSESQISLSPTIGISTPKCCSNNGRITSRKCLRNS